MQYEGPSCKGLQKQGMGNPVAPAGVQKSKASSASEAFTGLGGGSTRAFGGLGLQRVHAEGQGSLQGPRRGIQYRCAQCQRESNTSGR